MTEVPAYGATGFHTFKIGRGEENLRQRTVSQSRFQGRSAPKAGIEGASDASSTEHGLGAKAGARKDGVPADW